tara:strand:+ start:6017 stop:6370 length:354 start_codon:yes stop_codon:yes gene_type:complete
MKNLSILIAILIVTLLSACNTTPKLVVAKKPLISDHYLMLSLLNRGMTQDQQMMLAFAAHRASYQSPYFVNAVEIRGPKNNAYNDSLKSEYTTKRPTHSYSKLIAQDFNSVQISGPN